MRLNFKFLRSIDWFLLLIPLILVILGLAIIYSLTYNSENKLYISQLIFVGVGLGFMGLTSFVDYRFFKGSAYTWYGIGIFLLILVLVIGKTVFGAKSWIDLGFYDLQPSEFFKIFLIIGLGAFLSDKVGELNFKNLIKALGLIAIPVGLTMLQPDFGTAMILTVIGLGMIFATRIQTKYIVTFAVIVGLSLPVGWFALKDYQKERIMNFLNPTSDPYGSGYNVTQSIITVGNGGIFGQGFGHGAQSGLNFLPVAHTDFVFAGIAEATGFVGSVVLLLLFFIFLLRTLMLVKKSRDSFGSLVAVGVATFILVQLIINIGMNIGLLPVTGIPLPFISYGGTSLVTILIATGILQSIHIRHKKMKF